MKSTLDNFNTKTKKFNNKKKERFDKASRELNSKINKPSNVIFNTCDKDSDHNIMISESAAKKLLEKNPDVVVGEKITSRIVSEEGLSGMNKENGSIDKDDTPITVRDYSSEAMKEIIEDRFLEKNDDVEVEEIENAKEPVNDESKYITRDLSWLKFNTRILAMADDDNIPLLERLKFLSISASNLDEFTTIRINRLLKQNNIAINGMSAEDEVKFINDEISAFLIMQNHTLQKLLGEFQLVTGYELVRKKSDLTDSEKDYLKDYFNDKVKSLLTPIVSDNSRPFPLILNKSINIGVTIEDARYDRSIFGTVQVPNIERIIEIKSKEGNKKFILLEDLIKMNINKMFSQKKILTVCEYRLLRDLDFNIDNDDAFIVDTMKETLKRREMGKIMRLDISGPKKEVIKVLHKALQLSKKNIHRTENIIDLTFCSHLGNLNFSDELRSTMLYDKFEPQYSEDIIDESNMFDRIDEDDIILHHPYETYDTVVDFVRQASTDDDVVAIKQTLYRVSDDSSIMNALIDAAENGKQVTVILEAKARFDEANNLKWAAALERAGGHVIYGIDNYKIHCKMCLVVRRDKKNNLNTYVHVSTGNYNEINAKTYTDLSLFTSRKGITNEIERLFNALTGFGEPSFKKILASPYNLYESLIEMIDLEISNAKNKLPAKIIIKVNALTDKRIIDKLYEAGEAGVNVILIVRSSCSMLPSKNIIIKTILGRFLEHSRIYYFENNGFNPKYYIGSSDLMERNLDKRVELLIPVHEELHDKIGKILDTFVEDCSSGCYYSNLPGKRGNIEETNAQNIFIARALAGNNLENINKLYISK